MAQNYECVLLLTPTLSDEAVQGYQDLFSKIITDNNGEVVHVQRAPKRRLEYAIGKQREAVFVIFYFRADSVGLMAQEFERQIRINDDLLREMTVKVPELRVIDISRLDARPFGGDDHRRGRYGGHAAPAHAPVEPAPVKPAAEQPVEQDASAAVPADVPATVPADVPATVPADALVAEAEATGSPAPEATESPAPAATESLASEATESPAPAAVQEEKSQDA